MLKMIKYFTFKNFSVLVLALIVLLLELLKAGKKLGAGAITAVVNYSNISGRLLFSFIINNWKNESSISNFKELQSLQEEIRIILWSIVCISSTGQ